jgi:hypothetical protein
MTRSGGRQAAGSHLVLGFELASGFGAILQPPARELPLEVLRREVGGLFFLPGRDAVVNPSRVDPKFGEWRRHLAANAASIRRNAREKLMLFSRSRPPGELTAGGSLSFACCHLQVPG